MVGGAVAVVLYVRVLSIPPAVEVNCHARIVFGGSMLNWNGGFGMIVRGVVWSDTVACPIVLLRRVSRPQAGKRHAAFNPVRSRYLCVPDIVEIDVHSSEKRGSTITEAS